MGARSEVVRLSREIGEARIAVVLDPEANSQKATETRCKKLEAELSGVRGEIERLTSEAAAISGAIEYLEREISLVGEICG